MAATNISELIDSIQQSIASVSEAAPKLSALAPPEDGLSLLDVKNELLLSYLEHLVFLLVLKLRGVASGNETAAEFGLEKSTLGQSTVKKLVELRLYLEKGVRPLEDKLRYQIEKALRAAEESERAAVKTKAKKPVKDVSGSGSSAEDDDDDSDSDEDDESGSSDGSSEDDDDEDDDDDEEAGHAIDDEDAAVRPNRAAFVRPASTVAAATAKSGRTGGAAAAAAEASAASGVYRPPRIAPTMMPSAEKRERAQRRPLKSATMDEFIASELSTAPVAMPSIGTDIAGRGRHMKTSTERQREEERREYEERNFVRLPKEGKKERAKRARAEGHSSQMTFGGEDWRGLGEGVDRINRLTARSGSSRASGSGGRTRDLLEKSRKRGIDTVDGPRGSGHNSVAIGERFEKRLKVQEMGRRDRGKNR